MTFEAGPNSRPHAGGDGLLLFADSVCIDGRNFHDGVAHPLRHHIGPAGASVQKPTV
jgi:hypothetical protein